MEQFRTDMADERRDIYRKANKLENEIEGIETEKEVMEEDLVITRVKVLNEKGAQAIGKPKGNYVTIDIKKLRNAREEEIQKASEVVTKELKRMIALHVGEEESILVVGLGNIYVTPDSLGPKVVSEIDVTRHLLHYTPEYMPKDTREVSAVSPGVLGTTGIETLEILKGIVENVKPKLILIIDALASRSMDRISSSIQIADTGIVPGAGVGNKRKEISKETLGIPVIALGIPTVVEAATIAADSLEIAIKKIEESLNIHSNEQVRKIYQAFTEIKEEDKYAMMKEVLTPNDYNFIVTPKEIDELIENMKDVIARGINFATQKES